MARWGGGGLGKGEGNLGENTCNIPQNSADCTLSEICGLWFPLTKSREGAGQASKSGDVLSEILRTVEL
jgi:hypothetical protein